MNSLYVTEIGNYIVNIAIARLILLLIFLPGCHPDLVDKSVTGGGYYLNTQKDLSAVGRVAIVELGNNSSFPEISADITQALFLALQKKQLFGLTLIRQDDPTWRGLQLELEAAYNLEQLLAIRKTLKCDAVLLGTVTEYEPYPHLAVGLRMKLLDLKDGQLLWALEQVWDSADKKIESRIKDYFRSQIRSDSSSFREQLMVISSLKFIRFVAFEVAETLKPCQNQGIH